MTKRRVHKKFTRVDKRRPLKGGDGAPLTPMEEEVLHLLTVERLSPKQAATRRGVDVSGIYRTARRLRSMGLLHHDLRDVHKSGIAEDVGVLGGVVRSQVWELHGVKWSVGILEGQGGRSYSRVVGRGGRVVVVRGCTVECFRNTLKIHAPQSFFGPAPEAVVEDSWSFLFRLLTVLENDFRVILVKERATNIIRYAGHIAHPDDPVGYRPGGDRVVVLTSDGRRRVVVDWSKGRVPEVEFQARESNLEDAEEYRAFLHDLVAHRPPKLSELAMLTGRLLEAVTALTEQNGETAAGLKSLVDLLRLREPSSVSEDSDASGVVPSYVG